MKTYLMENLISIVALIISLYLFYKNDLSPFSLRVTDAGRIVLSKDPYTVGFTHALFYADLLFSNTGSKKGVVEDVSLKINDNGTSLIFFAKFFNTDRQMNLAADLPPPKLETFIGFGLNKDESVVKQIGFSQKEGEKGFSYKLGEYEADIYVFTSKSQKWKKTGKIKFKVEQDDIDQLNQMTSTPQPGGGFFIKMITRDKKTGQSIERLEKLKNE